MVATGTITASSILHHISAFISEILAQSELRKRLLSVVYGIVSLSDEIALKPLELAAEALENAIFTDNSSIKSSSLRCAEELLLSLPENACSSFLLSLIYGLNHQNLNSALNLLHLFLSDPSLARSEIAPILFEELFLRHFLPIIHWFHEQRSEILTFFPSNLINNTTEHSIGDESEVFHCTKSLSKLSIDQTLKLKELESNYERVLDKNCRVFAKHFKRVLERKDNGGSIAIPMVKLLDKNEKWNEMEQIAEQKLRTEQLCLPNGRYNPIWIEEEQTLQVDCTNKSKSASPPCVRSQVFGPFNLISEQESSSSSRTFSIFKSTAQDQDDSSEIFSLGSETEFEENDHEKTLFDSGQPKPKNQKLKQTITQSLELDYAMENSRSASPESGEKHITPPKDFVCPITCNIFYDPVTIETGQTYERSAIQEWLDRGNLTCPITGQKLQNTQLPKTNYVLKRLIASWLEENPNFVLDKALDEAESVAVLTSPVSFISQASIDRSMEMRRAITNLCTSEVLEEAETAVLCVERFWLEENVEGDVQHMLLKPSVINGLVEILVNSVDLQVLRAAIFLLSELGFKGDIVIETLTRVESDVNCIVTLFKRGVVEAVLLIYQLGLSSQTLQEMDVVGSLLSVVKKKEEDVNKMRLSHKSAAVLLLRKILGSKEGSPTVVAVLAENAIESILGSLKAKQVEVRIAAVGILLRCIQEDWKCRNIIADKADLALILSSFTKVSNDEQFEIIMFLSELVKLNRTSNEKILRNIKDGSKCSTMHSLLTYLQTAHRDQCPVVAGLLLQLDILVEPLKMSIYREEAMDALISCLRDSDFPTAQISAAETIMSLQGRFNTSGQPLARYFLLERAGLTKNHRKPIGSENISDALGEVELTREEDKATDEWERKMAFVLVNHDFGLLLEPLAKGLKSKCAALFSACFVSATWLSHMLGTLPDTGILEAARIFLLDHFLSIFTMTTDIEGKALALLAINSFVHEPEGLQYLSSDMKNIMRGLKEFRRSTPLAFDMLKVLCEGQDSSTELWSHHELFKVDCSRNGEVLSIAHCKDRIISGHSDGTMKVWSVRGTNLHLLQEIQEHSKGVTSLAVAESEEKLYSGSLDKTIKVWSLGSDIVQCIQAHDVKEQIHNLVVSKSVACFIPHGVGIRVYSWAGESKLLNSSKHVKCLNLMHGKLYCGCHDSSIQEVDLATGTVSYIHSGSRKLLGKANPIHALQVYDEQLFSASTALDGAAVKIRCRSNYGVIGSLSTAMDVRTMAVGSNLTYLGGKGGVVEIWSREKHNKIDTLQIGRNCKVVCMSLNEREDVLVIGTSDGRIQAWEL
ncbi:putative E3 ubiquitin-protein ligase LIN-1 isoform X2 [Cucurbita moschata]|uniref:RING-type E3 ubiquitin transferase n=1 Tax=Cucurbita moschata TaxID=3662 RepID=A0A6J1F5V1_CUCMO|nr:putative E3 ubiquitin-protein ligase LIN-1 isoform X2 [Cucurbita moschata]